MVRKAIIIAWLALQHAGSVLCQDVQNEDPAWQRYQLVLRRSTPEWLGRDPFLVKLEYQLYDLAGNPTVKGTAEQAWGLIPDPHILIQSPTLKIDGTESSEDLISRNTRENYLVHQALSAIVRPFPTVVHKKDFVMDQFQQDFGEGNLDCLALVAPGKRTAATPAYCTDADGRLTTLTGDGPYVLRRLDLRRFLDHWVPMDVELSYCGKMALKVHVLEFDHLQPEKASAADALTRSSKSASIPGDFLAGQALKKPEPKFPGKAKAAHLTGTVLLTAIITKEGKIAGLDVISSPDPLFSKSALDAVHKWTYKPYLLNGQPTLVDTTIGVNFNLSPK